MKYTIELDEKQVGMLIRACDFSARFIVGQVDVSHWPYEALHGKIQEQWSADKRIIIQEQIEALMRQIKMLGWEQDGRTSYGVRYNERADSLWDMQEVLRHQLWKDREGEKSNYTNDAYPAHHWNKKVPLITIKRYEP